MTGTMLAEQKLKAGQKENGARQSARSSASTYIHMHVHGQKNLYRFVSRCILPSRCWAHLTMHEHTHTRDSESKCSKESGGGERALDPGMKEPSRGRHAWRKNPGFPAGVATMETFEST